MRVVAETELLRWLVLEIAGGIILDGNTK